MQTRVEVERHARGDSSGDASTGAQHRPEVAPARRGPAARVVGIGAALPERIVTNEELERIVDTSDEWITARTGIRERRIAASKEAGTGRSARIDVQLERGATYLLRIRMLSRYGTGAAAVLCR